MIIILYKQRKNYDFCPNYEKSYREQKNKSKYNEKN